MTFTTLNAIPSSSARPGVGQNDFTGVSPLSIRKLALAALLSVSLSSAPVMAQTTAAPATVERAGVELNETNAQDGGFPFLIVFVVIAVGLGIYFAVNDSNNTPVSA